MKPSKVQISRGQKVILAKNALLRLEPKNRVQEVRIISGKVWLTETPADGDIILSNGEKRELAERGPYIIQALVPTELLLLPPGE